VGFLVYGGVTLGRNWYFMLTSYFFLNFSHTTPCGSENFANRTIKYDMALASALFGNMTTSALLLRLGLQAYAGGGGGAVGSHVISARQEVSQVRMFSLYLCFFFKKFFIISQLLYGRLNF
jgi:hypothetical protein